MKRVYVVRNPKQTHVTLSLRLPAELHKRIKRDADTPGRRMSLSQWIRNACEGVLVASNQPDKAGPNRT